MPRNTDTNTRYSICIGINTYSPKTMLGTLNYAENDARDMDEVLGERGFLPENRTLLLGDQATLEAVNIALGTTILDRAKENDLVVVYFAGHSTPVTIEDNPGSRRSEVFLATTDFNRQRIQASLFFRTESALGMNRLRQRFFEGPGSRKRLFIFDSCYSGDFYGPAYRDDVDQVTGYVQNVLNSGTDGRVFIASCLPYQKAVESSMNNHGHFTYYLLKALRGKAPEALRNNGVLTTNSLFDYLDDNKLENQRPVKGGVEHGSFELAHFSVPSIAGTALGLYEDEPGKEAWLRSQYIDQSDFVQDRLRRFVGRQAELRIIQERITWQIKNGGYVIITGEAGQGKSSIIARLIEGQGIDTSAYHFIQPGSGSNYQINLLRNIMARLILKYNLPEYYVAGESYPILCGNFFGVLKAIADKGAQEVIYIDGLDQLEMGSSPVPDLNFLPSRVPSGIVIVVGTRPNKTLDQLTSLDTQRIYEPYPLPGLSREDFDLLLQHHSVPLSPALSDSLYQRLTKTPLYLDLVALELRERQGLKPDELIARVESNPDSIFTLTFSRMQQLPDWEDVIRPILGVLLIAQEALSSRQIAHIFDKRAVRISAGMKQLGGLLTQAGQERYTLFHPKLEEYLQLDINEPGNEIQFDTEEEELLHDQVVKWCGQGSLEQLWLTLPDPSSRDDYQEYAQKYYIFHLYEARKYERLFEVLNQGDYERGKLNADRSTRSSAVDFMLGCRSAARGVRTLVEGKKLLNLLWRYTLLRTNLTTQADAYPIEAFQALLALDREREAFDLAELLTQPAKKLDVLILLTEYLLKQPIRQTEGSQLYTRVYEIALTQDDSDIQTKVLSDLATVLIHAGQLTRAESVAQSITSNDSRAKVLNDISNVYAEQHSWQQAENIARSIPMIEERIVALSNLAANLKRSNENEAAEILWQEVSTLVSAIADGDLRNRAIYYLSISFMQVKEWERAENAVSLISNKSEKVNALCQLALSFTQEGLVSQAEAAWEDAHIVVGDIEEIDTRDSAYRVYAIAQIQSGLHDEAETIANRRINNPVEKIAIFSYLVSMFMRESLWDQSKHLINLIIKEYDLTDVTPSVLDDVLINLSIGLAQRDQWKQAVETANAIPRKEARCRALMGIVSELARAKEHEMAQSSWDEARAMCATQTDEVQATVADVLVSVFIEIGQIEQAKMIIPTLSGKQAREYITEKIAVALAHAGQIAEAEIFVSTISNPQRIANIRQSIAIKQMQLGQNEQAVATAYSISNVERQAQILVRLVKTCCQVQNWSLAQEIASKIQPAPLKVDAMNHIMVGLVRAGKIYEAEALARSIINPFDKANTMCDLATILAQNGNERDATRVARAISKKNIRIQQKALSNISMSGLFGASVAESVARDIDAGSEREEALCNVAISYARENSWDDAERIAEEISYEYNDKRDEAWGSIARERASIGQWSQAVNAFDKIQKSRQRLDVLHLWGKLLAQPENKENQERILQRINKVKEKASLLISIASTLAEADHYLEQIYFTQKAWLHASTKDDCQYLFAMIRQLLLRNTEMCADLYGSFKWVDTFLKYPSE